jgi:hypothetical protein
MAARPVDDAVITVTEVTSAEQPRPARRRAPSKAGYDYQDPSRKRIPAITWRSRRYVPNARRYWAKITKLHEVGPGRPRGGCYLPAAILAEQLGLSERSVSAYSAQMTKGGAQRTEERSSGYGQETSIRWAVMPAVNPGDWYLDVPVGAIDTLRGWEYPVMCELVLRLMTNQDTGRRAIASALGISPDRVSEYVGRLADRALIDVDKAAGRQRSDIYRRARWSTETEWIEPPEPEDDVDQADALEEQGEGSAETTGEICGPATGGSCEPGTGETCAPCKGTFEVDVFEADEGLRSACDAPFSNAREDAVGGTGEIPAQETDTVDAVDAVAAGGLRPERKKAKAAAARRGARPHQKDHFGRRADRQLVLAVRSVVLPHAGAELLDRLKPGQVAELEKRLALVLEDDPELPAVRMSYRLRNAMNRTSGQGVRDPFAWVLTAATRRQGCADPNCEDGILWWQMEHGEPAGCRACELRVETRAAAKRGLTLLEPDSTPAPAPYQADDAPRNEVPTSDEYLSEREKALELMRANRKALAEREGCDEWRKKPRWKAPA